MDGRPDKPAGPPAEPPNDHGSGEDATSGVTYDELYRYIGVAERKYWEQSASGARSEVANRRYSRGAKYRMFWKTPVYTFGFGVPAILLLVGQFFVPWLYQLAGIADGNHVGYTRLVLLLVFIILFAIAAPAYQPVTWQPREEEDIAALHEDFQNKFRR